METKRFRTTRPDPSSRKNAPSRDSGLVKKAIGDYIKEYVLTEGESAMRRQKTSKAFVFIIICFGLFCLQTSSSEEKSYSSLRYLLPKVESFNFSETPQDYFPETLYEYINGAAEIYLGYNFNQLIVGQYQMNKSDASLSVEIYDMGNDFNSFGIYSAERFADAEFISVGNQGYLEEGTLNFIVGKYYVKLLCFDCGKNPEPVLRLFSEEILKNIEDKGQLPPLLSVLKQEGIIPNSEKFILRNFLGYEFLENGYVASFKLGDLEFDCFLIEGKTAEDARQMLKKYLEKRKQGNPEKISLGYHLKDRYYGHIFLAHVKNYLCGVMKIKDGSEKLGEQYLEALLNSLKTHQRPQN